MKYGDLVQFEPIETVVQLREADKKEEASRLVRTYVISRRMAENLVDIILPQLQIENPLDNKGLLVVGNYGTGKSHLMSVVTSLAEYPEMIEILKDENLKEEAKKISGKFKVIRTEIGAVTRSFRDIVCDELEKGLKKMGISFSFPPASEVTNHKDLFIEMMGVFNEKYPEKGLILAVDELLDYLLSRSEQQLILDLSFLREIGEVCRLSRFRFIAGLQEALFDNPRFEFVASSIRRVKDRFQQVRIVREDVSYVVSERLLKKDEKKKAWIRSHLERFTSLYSDMNERLDDYVNLFPIHPAYIETFERIYVAEKREILKTFSSDIRKIIDEDVQDDQPGIISYDSYWSYMKDDPSLNAVPEIKEVLEKGQILEGKIQNAYSKTQYRPAALRIIQGLSVYRLTTGDIYNPIGMTAEELRDTLCIFLPDLPEKDSEFLLTTVETVLNDILKTVSGQFISYNKDNAQYHIDLKKDIDYDAKIAQRADMLDKSKLDYYYFDALVEIMKRPEATYVSGYKIWEYEVIWKDHNIGRLGYLFFGAPNERSTAQPPRDFYIYFLQPFDPPVYTDEKKPDEVFFKLVEPTEDFIHPLKLYAGSKEMAVTSSMKHRQIYESKANEWLREIVTWLQEHMVEAFEVTYKGITKKMVEWGDLSHISHATVKESADSIAAFCLSSHFKDATPDYPSFSVVITSKSIGDAAKDALKWIRGGIKTKQGTAILDGLELLDGEDLKPGRSKYAKHILQLLQKKGEGQVLNHGEILTEIQGIEYDKRFRLEPEFVVVVLAALVYNGDIIISYPGKKVDASNLDELTKMTVSDLIGFKHVERPKELPLSALVELFNLLDLRPGLIKNPETRDDAAKALCKKTGEILETVVKTQQVLQGNLNVWNVELLSDKEKERIQTQLSQLKQFLESLQIYNTPGKLKNFKYTNEDITRQRKPLDMIKEVESVNKLLNDVQPLASYISEAEAILPKDDTWRSQLEEEKTQLSALLLESDKRSSPEFRQDIIRELLRIKKEYKEEYVKLHNKARLGLKEDEAKKSLCNDPRMERLNKLASIDILPKGKLLQFQDALIMLKPCYSFTQKDLERSPICPHCKYRPLEEAADVDVNAVIYQLEDRLEGIHKEWTQALLDNLDDPTVEDDIELIDEYQRKILLKFKEKKELPDEITDQFIKTFQDVFSGLEKVSVSEEDFKKMFGTAGTPLTVEEFRRKFEEYLQSLIENRDPKKIRIVLE
ncbi:MAG: ATP-binding protein [Theionarchaea archaeon]|nr:MAG: ATPase [Theionarchaea archaeon DG-70-1]MBU7026770.1 ATP-binding protein [Theionarchaea archaeon]